MGRPGKAAADHSSRSASTGPRAALRPPSEAATRPMRRRSTSGRAAWCGRPPPHAERTTGWSGRTSTCFRPAVVVTRTDAIPTSGSMARTRRWRASHLLACRPRPDLHPEPDKEDDRRNRPASPGLVGGGAGHEAAGELCPRPRPLDGHRRVVLDDGVALGFFHVTTRPRTPSVCSARRIRRPRVERQHRSLVLDERSAEATLPTVDRDPTSRRRGARCSSAIALLGIDEPWPLQAGTAQLGKPTKNGCGRRTGSMASAWMARFSSPREVSATCTLEGVTEPSAVSRLIPAA